MAEVVIFGVGQAAHTAFKYLTRDSEHNVAAFTVDRAYMRDGKFLGLPVVAFEEVVKYFPPDRFHMFVFMGYQNMNGLRAEKYLAAKEKGYSCVSYISSHNRFIDPPAIGENCFILGDQSIDLEVKIGNNVVLWSQNHIGDRSVIEDHVWLSSDVSISGDVTVKARSFLGVNCTICHNLIIGEKSFIGAGAVISHNTEPAGVYLAPQAQKGKLDSERFMQMVNFS